MTHYTTDDYEDGDYDEPEDEECGREIPDTDETPDDNWDAERLRKYIVDHNRTIDWMEKYKTSAYWRVGTAMLKLKPSPQQVESLGVNGPRATKARKIAKYFPNVISVSELTVEEAYQQASVRRGPHGRKESDNKHEDEKNAPKEVDETKLASITLSSEEKARVRTFIEELGGPQRAISAVATLIRSTEENDNE